MRPGSKEAAADLERVEALRRGDERAFETLVAEFQPGLQRMARIYVADPSIAEEVVQETWLAVIRGVFAFECRSSLKTWIFRILINRARTRAVREKRTVPFGDLRSGDFEESDAAASPEGFSRPGSQPGSGGSALPDLGPNPEQAVLREETQRHLAVAIDGLPANLRVVLTLRDVEGWSSEEVCNALAIRETNQRVLLHRARSKLRIELRPYLEGIRGGR